MTDEKNADQPTLFEQSEQSVEQITLYALGDFQARGKVLADRPLALDRLRGAFKRASEKFQIEELSDEKIAASLINLGAKVVKRPSFVAKHPYQITIFQELSEKAKNYYKEILNDN